MRSSTSSIERFTRSQAAVFSEAGITVGSRLVDVEAPFSPVHVLEAGSGTPVLLLHGTGVAAQWAPLISLLAPRFRLVMPEKPGCGLTGPFNYRGVNLREHGVELVRSILDALGHERIAVVGNSMGGFFALSFALAHPDRVSKLVLLGESAGADGNPRRFHRLVGTRGLNAVLYKTALKPASDAEGTRAGLARGRLVADTDRVSTDLLDCMAAGWQLPGAVRSWRTMVEQVFDPSGTGLWSKRTTVTHSLIPELASLRTPTLILWGDKDPLGSTDTGRMLAEAMPDARLLVVEDAGHLVWLDQPETCASTLTDFLDGSAR